MFCELLLKPLTALVFCAAFANSMTGTEPASSPRQADPKPTPEETAVRAVLEAQVSAWNKADIDGFMAGYWKDEKLTFISGGDITRGWEPTRERYVTKYQAEGKDKMGKLSFSELLVETLS